jgi:hypothetical protein
VRGRPSRCELAPERPMRVVQAGRRPLTVDPGQLWPMALLYLSAVLRLTATGCLEGAAQLSELSFTWGNSVHTSDSGSWRPTPLVSVVGVS